MQRTSGRIDILGTAMEPIHHGAGVSGNTQLLRVQEGVDPTTGRATRTPFISGNSLKHMVRECGARFAVDALAVKDGSLSKALTDLLFSGGALTKSGSGISLGNSRRLETMFPLLGLCGYSAGNVMTTSKLTCDNIHLVCTENAWRMPEAARGFVTAGKPAGYLRGEEFGTRHESSRRPHVARLLTGGETKRLEDLTLAEDKGDSAQMIYEYEVIKPGAQFWGAMHLTEVTDMELAALKSALSVACEGTGPDGSYLFRLGAKRGIGCGLVALQFSGSIRAPVRPPEHSEAKELVAFGDGGSDLDAYVAHLREHSTEITDALAEAVA